MDRFKSILRKLFFLPPLPTVITAVFGFAFVSVIAALGIEIPALQYLSYLVSAYALIITITGFPHFIKFGRSLKQKIIKSTFAKTLMKIPPVRRYFTEPLFKAKVSLYFGLLINLAYIVIKMGSGIYYRSLWLIALAIYYVLLAVMRIFLVGFNIKHSFGEKIMFELRRYRLIGVLLLILNLSLTVIVILVVNQNKGFEYPGLLIYAMAIYAFYSVTLSIINIVKERRNGSPAASAVRALNLIAAMVSMLSLTTAMLAQFGGDEDPLFRKVMTGCVGGGVCVIVIGMAIYMIRRATRTLKELQINNSQT